MEQLKAEAGTKYDNGKLRFDLLPVGPLEQVVAVLSFGATKYGDSNWRKGMSWSRCFAAGLRHSFCWFRGETYDKETGLHHLAHAIVNFLFIIEFTKTHPELDDRVIDNEV